MLPGIEAKDLLSLDNDKLLQVIPRIGLLLSISSLCKKNAKWGLKDREISSFVYNNTNSLIEADGKDQNTALLPMFMQMLGQQPVQPVQPAVDPLQQQISKSLHAIHKRQDASDELLAKIANKLEL